MGNFGAAAEAAARSLARAANASDNLVNASVREANAKSELFDRSDRLKNNFTQLGTTIISFSRDLISTTDSVASSNTVFTQVAPAITAFTQLIGQGGKAFTTAIGAGLGSLIGGIPTGAIGAKIGEWIGGTLSGAVELAGSIFNQYLSQGEKVVQAFNTLSTSGITFGGSLENMRSMIDKTNMPLEMLAKIAQQNAENLVLLGGGTAGALERVAKAARNDLGPQLVTLYGGFSNLSDELVDYLAMEQRRGVSANLLSEDNIEGTKAYLYQLKEISALTGKSSKQIKAEIEARSRNAATQGMYANMTRQQQSNFDKLMQTIPEGAREAMQDLVLAQSRGLEPVSRQFLELEATAPGLVAAMRRAAGDLGKSPEEFNESLGKASADMATESSKITQMMGDILYLKQAGRVSASVISTLDTTLTSLNENKTRLLGVADDIKTFAEQTSKLKETATSFTTSVEGIYKSQSEAAIALNKMILGDKDTPSKFNEFADATIFVTNTMTAFANKFDDLVDSLFVRSTLENREKFQNERIDLEKKTLDDLKIGKGRLLEPYVTDGKLDESKIPSTVLRQVKLQDERIQAQINKLNQLQQGLINIQELKAKEAEDKRKKEEEVKREAERNQRYINEGPTAPATPDKVSLTGNDSSQFATLIERQNEAMNNLALALNNQGGEIKRAVDRIPT
jgi:hypothetical protein